MLKVQRKFIAITGNTDHSNTIKNKNRYSKVQEIIILVAVCAIINGVMFTPTFSHGAESEGSIQVNVYYSNGDRAASFGNVLKIYQEGNEIPFKIIEPNSFPVIIDSLPLDHKYKIDVYRYDMYAASSYVNLKEILNKLEIQIPLNTGILFNVFYKDGKTPVHNATISLKSHSGKEWAKSNTDDNGNSIRLWVQPIIKDGDYYTASFSIGKNFTYVYPSELIPSPGSQTNIKIITPWLPVVEQLITISVYKSTNQKVQFSDGDFLVEAYDESGKKVAQSNVTSHGQAYFSKVKSGNYRLVVQKDINGSLSKIGSKNVTIFDQVQPFYDIYLQENSDDVISPTSQNQTSVIPQVSQNQTNSIASSCNCVIFRLDGVQDNYLRTSQLAVMNLFLLKNKDLTTGIIMNHTGNDLAIIGTVKEGIEKRLFYPALQGYDFIDYTTLSTHDQWDSINLANKKMVKLFGNKSDIFIPPINKFNDGTVSALENSDIHILSAGKTDNKTYHYSNIQTNETSQIFEMPQQKHYQHQNYNVTDVKDNLKKYGYAVITLMPQDFTKFSDGKYLNANNGLNYTQIKLLSSFMDELTDSKIQITNFYEVSRLPVRIFPSSYDLDSNKSDNNSTLNLFTIGKSPASVVVNQNTNTVYVANSESNSVSVIDGSTNSIVNIIAVGKKPLGISINTVTNMIYLINTNSGTISVINGSTNSIVKTIDLNGVPFGIDVNPISNKIYVIDPFSTINYIDGNSNKVTNKIKMDGNPQRISVNPVTNMMYVTESNSVSVIDESTNSIVKKIQLDSDSVPIAITTNPVTNMIYVTDSKYGSIHIIDGSTNSIVKRIQLDSNEIQLGISVNSVTNKAYVSNMKSGTLSILDTEPFSAAIPEFSLLSPMILVISILTITIMTRLEIRNVKY